eukprot:CAMPEP_0172303652 /NCGR_PEP_ID=MMETSP1058-20130122/5169_1 /TAXON_ID=83371 /ORGANISM="Detonula confervacea, Strain CCMP 353" /LENGTH=924 /DNA_ID=CAMNT_0013014555 /DNA_START=77 /DNA_END=2854 /DNA_ORIENTATION=+
MARGRRTRGRGAAVAPEDHDDSSDDNDNAAAVPQPPAEEDEQQEHDDQQERQQDGNANDESMQDGMEEDAESPARTPASNNNNRSPANNPSANEEEDDSTLKILLSTDNHLGYLERDPIRGRDSFAALEEVLSLARHHKVDMVLLSGDLFHDNKPSRKTLHTTMEILRRYCMGGESVGFQIVSDQKECLRSIISGRANYEDEFYSVDLPIFTIHGNHDDPTRDGGPDLLSAVDLLSISNLVNYFGRQDDVEKVKVSPVLIQKGDTKVALYGMGSMRDERLNRMWQGKKVKFLRPEQGTGDEDYDDNNEKENKEWFNIFTLHQNRDLGRGSKNCVHESMIPEWMDLVVWGHEHECLINPSESLVGTFRITQPGSSVATSLTAGEARRKHCGLLEIKGHQFRLQPLTLSSVRSFAVGEVNLGERAREQGGVLDVEDPKVEERMSEVLAAEVDALIQKARDESEILQQDADAEAARSRALEDEFDDSDKRQRKYSIKNPEKVLVRLKVEHTGFTTLNNQRFGSQFVGQVANPSDILLFHKRRQAENSKGGKAAKKKRGAAGLDVPVEPENLEDINIEDLVTENLVNNDKKLELLDEKSMGEALEQFVDKMETRAISIRTEQILEDNQKILMKRARGGGEDGEASAMDNPTSVREFLLGITGKKRAEFEMEMEDAAEEKEKKKAAQKDTKTDKGGSSKSAGARKRTNSKDDDSMSGSEEEERPTKKKSRVATTAKKTTAKSRKKYDDSDDDFDDDFEDPPPKKRATAKKATAKKATASKARSRRADDSDSEIEYMGNTQSQAPSKPAARSSRAGRSTAKKTKYAYNDSDVEEIDDDSDVEETPRPTARGGKKKAAARSAGTSKARASSQTQSTLTSFTSARKPATASRGGRSRVQHMESDSDDEPSSGFGGGGAWGSASQSTKGRGRR